MKKSSIYKWLIVLVVFCVMGLSACKETASDPKRITVTGIPSVHNGRYGVAGIGNTSNGSVVAIGAPELISNGSCGSNLYDPSGRGYEKPYTGSGTFIVAFLIYDTSLSTTYYEGGILAPKQIKNANTTFSFNEFFDFTSNITTPRNMKDAIRGVLKELNAE